LNSTSFTFFADDQSTELNWELEEYDSGTGELVAWVNVTSVSSSSDTSFYLYYDSSTSSDGGEHNPTDTWDSDYLAVWHMNDGGSTLDDSTSNAKDGTIQTGVVTGASGISGDCLDFDGQNGHYVDISNTILPDSPQTVTMETWVNVDAFDNDWDGTRSQFSLVDLRGENSLWLFLGKDDVSGYIRNLDCECVISSTQYGSKTASVYTTNAWFYSVGTVDTTTSDLDTWVNTSNTDNSSASGSFDSSSNDNCLADSSYQHEHVFNGQMDEVRISGIVRSDDYIKTNYNMLHNKTTFVSFGSIDSTSGTYEINGLNTNGNFTWSGQAGEEVWSNDTSDGTNGETMNIYTNVSGTSENCTDIFIDVSDFDGGEIFDHNMSIALINTSDGAWGSISSSHTITETNGNLTINSSVWSTGVSAGWIHGTNPFPIVDYNSTIAVRVKISIPSGASTGTVGFSTSGEVLWKVVS
jgi:hypothetical protein